MGFFWNAMTTARTEAEKENKLFYQEKIFPVKDCSSIRCPDAWTGFFCTGFFFGTCSFADLARSLRGAQWCGRVKRCRDAIVTGQLKSNNSWYWWDWMHLSGHLTKTKGAVCGPWRILPPIWVAINPLINQKYLKLWLTGVNLKCYEKWPMYHEILFMIGHLPLIYLTWRHPDSCAFLHWQHAMDSDGFKKA